MWRSDAKALKQIAPGDSLLRFLTAILTAIPTKPIPPQMSEVHTPIGLPLC